MTTPDGIIRCPDCGGADVRRSYAHGLADTILMLLGKKPLRCRGCERRFYRSLGEGAEAADPSQAAQETTAPPTGLTPDAH
jgi:hypothetical protein